MFQNKRIPKARARSKYGFKATLRALAGMSYNHFPLIMPGVHPLVALLIMFRLKRRGFSNCRVEASGTGLVVYADR